MTVLATLALALLTQAAPLRQARPQIYDPSRDAAADIRAAVDQAARSHKRVLMQVGGNWCGWCHLLERFFEEHPDLRAFRDSHYVLVKVNYSPERPNRELLANYPKIAHYPHLFVLGGDGKLLYSQDVAVLEEGRGYGPEKIRAFLERCAIQ